MEARMHGQLAAGHDHLNMPQRAQILQRVCGGHDQIRTLARHDGAGLAADPGELRAPARRGIKSEGVADAGIFVEIKQLAPEIILRDPRAADVVVLADEVLTPDSSRFWPAASYKVGANPPSLDKQYVRDWLDSIHFNHQPPGPVLPDEVIAKTREIYRKAYRDLSGRELA